MGGDPRLRIFEPNLLIILENIIMKKIALVITAATIAVASTAASAWGWGDNGYNNGWGDGFGDGAGDFDGDFGFGMNMSGRGHGRGYGNGYNGYRGYNGYGYAPYGYAPYGVAPIQPAVEMTEEQKQAIADQQAAEFYANQRAPMGDMYSPRMEQREARIAEMEARMEEHRKAADARAPMTGMRGPRMEQREARFAEMDARMEAFIKESDARRAEFEAAHKARLQERAPRVEAEKGA
jgi:hypothetical protein